VANQTADCRCLLINLSTRVRPEYGKKTIIEKKSVIFASAYKITLYKGVETQ